MCRHVFFGFEHKKVIVEIARWAQNSPLLSNVLYAISYCDYVSFSNSDVKIKPTECFSANWCHCQLLLLLRAMAADMEEVTEAEVHFSVKMVSCMGLQHSRLNISMYCTVY